MCCNATPGVFLKEVESNILLRDMQARGCHRGTWLVTPVTAFRGDRLSESSPDVDSCLVRSRTVVAVVQPSIMFIAGITITGIMERAQIASCSA